MRAFRSRPRRPFAPAIEGLEARRPLANVREAAVAQALDAGLSAMPREWIAEVRGRSATIARFAPNTTPITSDGRTLLLRFDSDAGARRAINALRADRSVRSLTPNAILRPTALANDPYYAGNSQWGTLGDNASVSPSIKGNAYGSQAEEAWAAGVTGSRSVVVGILDKGVMINHPDLAANIWTNPYDPVDGIDNDGNGYVDDIHGWDFAANDNTVYDGPVDDHGTLVAGTIGAVGGNGEGIAGVNWNVTLLPAKILGAKGGTLDSVIRALDYLTDLKTRHGINIVATNNSWTGGLYCQPLADAITRAAKANILFVAAAGNGANNVAANNDAKPTYPSSYSTLATAGYEAVISVAAIANKGALASYSNYGATSVDIAAPGTGIVSTLPAKDGSPTYASKNGTSMAAPFVTGAIALYAAAHPTAGAAQIRRALLTSAVPTPSLAGKVATGGRLDIGAMLAQATSEKVMTSHATTQSQQAQAQGKAKPVATIVTDTPANLTLRASRPRTRVWWRVLR